MKKIKSKIIETEKSIKKQSKTIKIIKYIN
jgi:hypothetical protein